MNSAVQGVETPPAFASDRESASLLHDTRLTDPHVRQAVLSHLDALERGDAPHASPPMPPLLGNKGHTRSGSILKSSFRADADLLEHMAPPTLTELMMARDDELEAEAADVAAVTWDDEQLDGAPSALPLPAVDQKELYEFLKRDTSASRIQQAWRMKTLGFDAARIVQALHIDAESALTKPSRAVAKEVARDMLARRSDGELFEASEGLAAFDAFGVEVSGYMRFLTYIGRLFWVLLALNLSNIISNFDGGHTYDLLAAHSLNNADCLGFSYGIIEALTSAILVGFTYWMRGTLLRQTANSAYTHPTPTPPHPTPASLPAFRPPGARTHTRGDARARALGGDRISPTAPPPAPRLTRPPPPRRLRQFKRRRLRATS